MKTRESAESRRRRHERNCIESCKPVIECAECGVYLRSLAGHIYARHGLTRHEYLVKHKLPRGTKLTSPDLIATFRKRFLQPERFRRLQKYLQSPKAKTHASKMNREFYAKRMESIKARPLSEETRQFMVEKWAKVRPRALSSRRQANRESGKHTDRICQSCGIAYETKASQRVKYCGAECYHKSKRGKEQGLEHKQSMRLFKELRKAARMRLCAKCGAQFDPRRPCLPTRFCSPLCANSCRERDAFGRMKAAVSQ